jgi:hypothetical protein
MKSEDLKIGDWISIPWIAYRLYVVGNTPDKLIVSSPSWRTNDTMNFHHSRLDMANNYVKLIGKSNPNPLYNSLTKITGFIHPFVLNKTI